MIRFSQRHVCRLYLRATGRRTPVRITFMALFRIFLPAILAGLGWLVLATSFAAAAQPAADSSVIARVDDETISRTEAEYELKRVTRGKEVLPETLPTLQAAVLQALIDRRLVLRQLTAIKRVASEADVEQAVLRLQAALKTRGETLTHHLLEQKLSAEDLRQQFRWQLSWEKYLAERSTAENLQKFFEKHRPHFDGTERRAAHILWKVPADADAATREKIREQAAAVQAEIVAGKITFAAAAEKHSQGPSAKSGGDIGFIRRHEPMPESFAKAVFDLPASGISEPIATTFGWHVVQWTEEKPGQRTWQEAEHELRPAVASYLFEYHAAQERQRSPKIEGTADWPLLPR